MHFRKLFVFICLFGFSFLAFAQNQEQAFDYGQYQNRTYSNNYFGFKVDIPQTWIIKSYEQRKEEQLIGYQENAGDNATLQSLIDKTVENTKVLLSVSQYHERPIVGTNPFLKVVAENISAFTGVTNSAYLSQTKYYSEISPTKTKCKNVYLKQINGQDFAVLRTKTYYQGFSIKQEHYTIIKNDYALTFTLSYINKEDKRALANFFSTTVFQ